MPGRFSVLLAGLVWMVAACGRVGVELLPAKPGTDGGVVPSMDGGVVPSMDGGGGRGDAAADAGHVDAGCTVLCANEHGTASCSSGDCEISCEIGYADCDGLVGNGCETSTTDDVMSCGSCELQCTTVQGATACADGVCRPRCIEGVVGDCDGNTQNGCETELDDNPEACGICGKACLNPHGSTQCVAGRCTPVCEPGYTDCDGVTDNGCETRTETDPAHCGACNIACDTAFQICDGATCQVGMCPQGRGECGGVTSDCEADLMNDTDDCGFCGNVCVAANGMPRCIEGGCAVAGCEPAFGDCDGLASNGCEAGFATDVAHCGGCGNACSNGHGTTTCAGGMCAPTCSSGWGSCDSAPENGCETPLDTVANCGNCGNACPNAVSGASAVCNAGVCSYSCDGLSGVYALRINAQATWPAKPYVRAGSGQLQFWLRMTLTQSGTSLSGIAQLCDQTTPETRNSVTTDRYLLAYPSALFTPGAPAAAFTATLASQAPGAGLSSSTAAHTLGLTMADPLNGTWPALSTVRTDQVDHDADGKLGITTVFVDDASYNHVQTSGSLTAARASHSYGAQRLRFSLGGALTACSGASGAATVQSFDTRNIGCRLESNADCNSSQYTHVDNNAVVYSVTSATYSMTLLGSPGSTFTCAQVRAAL